MSLNKVMLIGNVGKDPEVRYTGPASNGTKCASFSLATTERYKDRNGETKELTEWHNIVVWRGLADIVEKYVRKGTQLFVEGKIKSRTWDDDKGNRRYATEIIADSLQMLGGKSSEVARNVKGARQLAQQQQAQQSDPFEPQDDDLPF